MALSRRHAVKRSRWTQGVWIGGLVAIVLLVAGIAGLWFIPTVDQQLRTLQPVLLVRIPQPVNGQQVIPGEPMAVSVTVDSAGGLHSLEAYADDVPLVLVATSPLVDSPVTAIFHWTPPAEGTYYLTARAAGLDGRDAVSSPVRVEAVLPVLARGETVTGSGPTAVLGISLDSPAFESELETLVDRLLQPAGGGAAAAFEFPNFPLPASQIALVPRPVPLPGPIGQALFAQNFRLWFAVNFTRPASPPIAPELGGSVEGCAVSLWINDRAGDELGVRLFRLDPFTAAWSLAADLRANPGTGLFAYTDPDPGPGKQVYYAASFNAGGESPGNLISLEVSAQKCAARGPLVLSLADAQLTLSYPVDKLYCYASMNGADWGRIPRSPDVFILPVDGKFDLSPHLRAIASPQAPRDFTLECWGWTGGGLVELGRLNRSLSEGPQEIAGDGIRFRGDLRFDPARPGDIRLSLMNFAPPFNLEYPDSLAACWIHTGSDASLKWACENLIDWFGKPIAGHAILLWRWDIHDQCSAQDNYCGYNIPLSDVQGFHVYREDPGQEPVLIQTVNSNAITMAVLAPGEIGSATAGTRYFVRAFTGNGFESGDSNYLGVVSAGYHMTIPAQFSGGTGIKVYKSGGDTVGVFIEADPNDLGPPPDLGIDIGYIRHHSENLSRSSSFYFDGYIGFDISQVPGMITGARLLWDGTIITAGPGQALHADRCRNQVLTFWGDKIGYGPVMMLSMDEDVTNYLLAWQQIAVIDLPLLGMTPENFGFWLLSGDRSLAYTDYALDMCIVRLENVRLEVEYVK